MSIQYGNYDNEKVKNLSLKVANSRGKCALIRDIKKQRDKISDLLVEINPCDGKNLLKECRDNLNAILAANI